jgi:hypothetical protein
MDITNKTGKPLNVPLPGGKKLFLTPGKTGQVNPKVLAHPPLAKLIEAGDVEAADGEANRAEAGGGRTASTTSGVGNKGTGAMRQSGDR